ncbi:hypothetical protein ACFXAS_21075 [Streptomyces sp. NPDC059459]|uniref:ATP-dependent DNA ligase n=1 Tax=Streptomyces sp. NPDC059459 TaxID=3346839 RepID=UPI0036B6440C
MRARAVEGIRHDVDAARAGAHRPTCPGPTLRQAPLRSRRDGYRAQLARFADGRVLLRSRQGTDMTGAFPEIRAAALAQLPEAGLDGELVVWEGERLAFERLQQRLARRRGAGALAAASTWPAHPVVFDVTHPDGTDLTAWPYARRRAALEILCEPGVAAACRRRPGAARAWPTAQWRPHQPTSPHRCLPHALDGPRLRGAGSGSARSHGWRRTADGHPLTWGRSGACLGRSTAGRGLRPGAAERSGGSQHGVAEAVKGGSSGAAGGLVGGLTSAVGPGSGHGARRSPRWTAADWDIIQPARAGCRYPPSTEAGRPREHVVTLLLLWWDVGDRVDPSQ